MSGFLGAFCTPVNYCSGELENVQVCLTGLDGGSDPRRNGELRLVTAYQEGLVTLLQLRQRMPALQKQTQAVESELQSLKMAAVDETK
jgi:hypothetical protein